MEFRQLHGWRLSYSEARELQTNIAGLVCRENALHNPRLIAGIDARYEVSSGAAIGAVVILSYPQLELCEVRVSKSEPLFPYIPGLLSFRECPAVMDACKKVSLSPDLVFVDGQGIAHPRRIGLGSHVGLLLDLPTIGCAKSRLIGKSGEPGEKKGSWRRLADGGETVGAVLRTRQNTRPVYVSIGHKVDLRTAIRWTLACSVKYRIPEPTRLAHLAASGRLPELEPE